MRWVGFDPLSIARGDGFNSTPTSPPNQFLFIPRPPARPRAPLFSTIVGGREETVGGKRPFKSLIPGIELGQCAGIRWPGEERGRGASGLSPLPIATGELGWARQRERWTTLYIPESLSRLYCVQSERNKMLIHWRNSIGPGLLSLVGQWRGFIPGFCTGTGRSISSPIIN